MSLVVAIVGATGAVGRTLLTVLDERRFPIRELRLLATTRSQGESVSWRGTTHRVEVVDAARLAACDLVFLTAGTEAARTWAPLAVGQGAAVVDNSYAFRMDPAVPLVVPEVNVQALDGKPGLVANPNCSTIALVLALAPLHRQIPVRRVVVSTYQSVSGTGADALRELDEQVSRGADAAPPQVYPHPIAFNCIPQVDDFLEDGVSREERKMVMETRKILGEPELRLTATTVRVPVRVAHSLAVNLEFTQPVAPEEARRWLAAAPGVEVWDEPGRSHYPTPLAAAGRDEAFVGRIRRDPSCETGLDLWISCDNLRKGAALNAVQIAEHLPQLALGGSIA